MSPQSFVLIIVMNLSLMLGKKFVMYADLVYGVNDNKDHIFKYHLFKPRAVLLDEAFFSHKAPKSVFFKRIFQKILFLI